MFLPLILVLAAALGLAPVLQWKRTRPERLVRELGWVAVASVVLGVLLPLVLSGAVSWKAVVALVLALWVVGGHSIDLLRRARLGVRRIPLAYWGMTSAHLGFAVSLVGIALTSVLSVAEDVRMAPGQTRDLGPVEIRFDGVTRRQGPNYLADRGSFVVTEDGREIDMHPEKRRYLARSSVTTEAAINAGFTRDIYVSLGEPLGGGAWSVRIQHKPFVRWVWFGGLFMALGGALAVADARYRRLRRRVDGRSAIGAALAPPGGGG